MTEMTETSRLVRLVFFFVVVCSGVRCPRSVAVVVGDLDRGRCRNNRYGTMYGTKPDDRMSAVGGVSIVEWTIV